MSSELIAADIGGTNARFCRVLTTADGVPELKAIRKYRVSDHAGLAEAWRAFAGDEGAPLPPRAAIAIAGPITAGPIKLTNSHWIVDPSTLARDLDLDAFALINDFEAMAYGVSALPRDHFELLFGPDGGLPEIGAVTVLGPGTGLGVAILSRTRAGPQVIATEGGHIGFSPLDAEEDRLFEAMRARFGRVSIERLVSGPGLNLIHEILAASQGLEPRAADDSDLWREALAAEEGAAHAALRRLCLAYGSVAGDLALAHGARCLVLAGDLTGRMKRHPLFGAFYPRFVDKGRYRSFMQGLPVYHAEHPELGLFGAAVAGQTLLG